MYAKLQREWKGDILLNFGSQHSKGTAILFKGKYNIIDVHKSEDSRIILANIKIDDKTFTVLNIYAPNIPNERKHFFLKIQKWVDKFAQNEQALLIGGDFNFTEENRLDRATRNEIKDVSATSFKSLTTSRNLLDVWRHLHPHKKQFTYKDISRLDKFLISTELLDNAQKSNILIPGIKSDHKCITIELDLSHSDRGPGRC